MLGLGITIFISAVMVYTGLQNIAEAIIKKSSKK